MFFLGGVGSAVGTLAARHATVGRPEIAGKVNPSFIFKFLKC